MTAVLLSLVVALTPSLAAERLNPQPLATFDGKAWSGLTLGSLTDGDIKKLYQTDKGAVRPEALKLLTVKDSGVRVDALLDGRGDKAVMRAIRLEYDTPLDIETVVRDLGEDPVALYLPERNEDWRILAFVDRGILAVDLNGRFDTFFLCAPGQVGTALRDFSDRQSSVTAPVDPGRSWDRIVRFSDSDATVSLGSSRPDWMNTDWRRRLERRLENAAEAVREASLRYTSSANGRLTIRATSDRFNSSGEANFTVTVSVSAATPYGKLDKSASRSRKLGESYERKIIDLLEDAVEELSRDLQYAIQRLGPPPKEQSRRTALDRLMDGATRKPPSER